MNRQDTVQEIAARPSSTFAIFVGMFFVSMAVLVLQVTLTRIFSITMWYHFSYLIISLALLGFGASGSFLTLRGITDQPFAKVRKSICVYALLFGFSILVSFFVFTQIKIDTFTIWKNPSDFLGLVLMFLILVVPFLTGGLAIGSCLSLYSRDVSKLYFVDLVGAALGAIACPLLLSGLGPTATIMFAGTVALFGGMAFSYKISKLLFSCGAIATVFALVLSVGFSGGWSVIPNLYWDLPYAPNKVAAGVYRDSRPEASITSVVAQVDVSEEMTFPNMAMGGNFGVIDQAPVEARFVTQDGTAPTMLFKDSNQLDLYPQLDDTQAASGYVVLNAEGEKSPDVMVIGVGGGVDVMVALYHQARSVTAVEINAGMIEMATSVYKDYIGNLFDNAKVTIVNEDGRSHLGRVTHKYDLIQLSGVDTFTALSTGAYTLSESYLYTTEAIQEMFKTLKPGGIITFSRMIFEGNPRETIRLANTAFHSLESLGITDPQQHIAVFRGDNWASTMIKESPFNQVEIDKLNAFAEVEQFHGLIFNPLINTLADAVANETGVDRREKEYYFKALKGTSSERQAFVDNYKYDLEPPTDDSPFFFNYFRFDKLFASFSYEKNAMTTLNEYLPNFPVGHMVLLSSLLIISVLALALIVLPLRMLRSTIIPTAVKFKTFLYFGVLGMGYMFIEIGLMQKFILFLGHPVYSMSVVLGGMLAFSGFGALFSNQITVNKRVLNVLILCILMFCVFIAYILPGLLQSFQGSELSTRILLTLLFLGPGAFVLGIPFPIGIKMLESQSPQLIPWGWAINGFLSVLSSILVVIVAMKFGFTNVIIFAAAIYAIGLFFAPLPRIAR